MHQTISQPHLTAWDGLRMTLAPRPDARWRTWFPWALTGLLLWGIVLVLVGLKPPVAALIMILTASPFAIRSILGRAARDGWPITIAATLLVTQTIHTFEHLVQVVQHWLLGWPTWSSGGVISPLNAEYVHFAWDVFVMACIVFLLRTGSLRGFWAVAVTIWAGAHTTEHVYMLWQYLETQRQGLPGFLGIGGLLDRSGNPWLCDLPGLTTVPRVTVHFWWNAGEVALLFPAIAQFGARITQLPVQMPPSVSVNQSTKDA